MPREDPEKQSEAAKKEKKSLMIKAPTKTETKAEGLSQKMKSLKIDSVKL